MTLLSREALFYIPEIYFINVRIGDLRNLTNISIEYDEDNVLGKL